MTVVLALLAAFGFGASDFLGGFGSRKEPGFGVTLVNQVAGGAGVLLALAATGLRAPGPSIWWGALAGVGGGLGIAFLYRGLAAGRMGVVAPVSAIATAVLPVAVAFALGERPGSLVWLGVALALPGVWLVASGTDSAEPHESSRRGLLDGLLAGVGFGIFFIGLGQVPSDAGLLPLAVAQVTALAAILLLALISRSPWVPRTRAVWWGVAAGTIGAAAQVAFLLAAQSGLLTVAAVLASLYPAATVLLAVLVLRERVHRPQAIGLALCLATVALVAAG